MLAPSFLSLIHMDAELAAGGTTPHISIYFKPHGGAICRTSK